MPTISLVGYTNAGKSTLFNALTGAYTYVANQLFATLDPTVRRVDLPGGGPVALSDTVGFIRDLPHDLVAAFRATLEEAVQADLLLVVTDAADPLREERTDNVASVLSEIEADGVPRLMVMNQIDRMPGVAPHIDRNEHGEAQRVWVSARAGWGLELLREAIAERLRRVNGAQSLHLPASGARLRARLYRMGVVAEESTCKEGGWDLTVRLDTKQLSHLCQSEGIAATGSEPAVSLA
jgi:GTP-binding protein HflX